MVNTMLANLIKLLYGRVHDMSGDIRTLRDEVDCLRNRLARTRPGRPDANEAILKIRDHLKDADIVKG